MSLRRTALVAFLCICCGLSPMRADEGIRYYEQDGLMYRESRIKIRHPINDVKYKELKQTYYRDEYRTELKPVVQNTYVPVTTYGWQPEVYGKWNPLGQPHVAYRPVPKVSWSVQPQTIQVPVTRRIAVPETRTVHIPETNMRYEEREYVQRVPVGPAPTRGSGNSVQSSPDRTTAPENNGLGQNTAPNSGSPRLQQVYHPPAQALRQQNQFGGVARFDTDPPRYGVMTTNNR